MHPKPQVPEVTELQRLLRLRFPRREALCAALLDALFGSTDPVVLDAAQRRRLAALLEGRTDEELESIARRGHPGSSVLSLQLDVLLDGVASPAEQERMTRALLSVLQSADWPAATVRVRSVVLADVSMRADSAD